MNTTTRNLVAAGAIVLVAAAAGLIARHKQPGATGTNMAKATPTASAAAAVATTSVSISGYAFQPAVITVKVGTTVTWTNTDAVNHTVMSDTGNELASQPFARGETYSHTFATVGTYSYHCMPHPYMKGMVVVTE